MWKKVALLTLLGLVLVATQGVEKRRTGNVCRSDFECPDNSFCKDASYCMCKEGNIFVSINDTHKGCLQEARFGDPCIKDIQCHVMMSLRAECANGVCRCSSNSHLEMDKCYQTAVVGERCMVDANCYLGKPSPDDEKEAFCVRGYCVCPMNFSPRDNGTRCVRDAGLGETCEDNQQCAGPGLECRGTCQCRESWVPHNESKRCIEEKPKAIETPIHDANMQQKTEPCSLRCNERLTTRLVRKEKDKEIIEEHYRGYSHAAGMPVRTVLVSVKSLGDQCEYDTQCYQFAGSLEARTPGTALCLGGVCSCAYNARKVGEFCYSRRRPGTQCQRDEECVSEEDEPGYCFNGICTCKNCGPDDKDFYGGASTLSRPPVIVAAIFSIAAILRQ